MNKSVLTMVLVLAVAAMAQQPSTTQPPATGAGAQAGQAAQAQPEQQAPEQKKEIKDPAEYNAYIAALRAANPQAQAQAFESFLEKYPNSVVKQEALEQLMAAYEKLGNAAKTTETAHRLLQVDPQNLRALALLAYTSRQSAEQGGAAAQQNAVRARDFGMRGLRALQSATQPAGMSDVDWTKFKDQVASIFNGAVGFGAMQAKDYATAQKYLQAAVDLRSKINPSDPANLRDIYPLALAYLEATPPNPLGLWYVARAAVLSNNNPQIVKYGEYKYVKYHGSPEGWDQLLAQAKTAPAPPAGFTVAPAPSLEEQARILAGSKDPKKMTFDELQLILSHGTPEIQQQVWSQIKGTQVPFAAKVISTTRDSMQLAATVDDIQQNVADVTVTLVAPCVPPRCKLPKAGEETQVLAKFQSYTSNPFMINMGEGQLIAKSAPKTGAKKRPTGRRR